MKKQLGIKPKMSLKKRNNTIEWYEGFYYKKNIKDITYQQTINYISS